MQLHADMMCIKVYYLLTCQLIIRHLGSRGLNPPAAPQTPHPRPQERPPINTQMKPVVPQPAGRRGANGGQEWGVRRSPPEESPLSN